MTSAGRPDARIARAISIARSVLPVAVGPATITRGGRRSEDRPVGEASASVGDADMALPSPP